MIKTLILYFLFISTAVANSVWPTLHFTDDFNSGHLEGWSIKLGERSDPGDYLWSNPGDYLLSSYDNYGVIFKNDSFGYDQSIQIDAFFDDGFIHSKTAQLKLRSRSAGWGPNPYRDHGYFASILDSIVVIDNVVAPFYTQQIGKTTVDLAPNTWHTIKFEVKGSGNDTNLKLWINDILYMDVFDTLGSQHDDGGYLALGPSNHINRRIKYDNFIGITTIPLPTSISLYGIGIFGFIALFLIRRVPQSSAGHAV